MYETEDIIRQAIKPYKRNKFFVATKVWPEHFKYNDIVAECNRYLKKIQNDYIGPYRFHWIDKEVNINETMEAMEKLNEIAKKYNSTIYRIALAWLMEKNVFPIPKALNIDHLKENIEATNIQLDDRDIDILSGF